MNLDIKNYILVTIASSIIGFVVGGCLGFVIGGVPMAINSAIICMLTGMTVGAFIVNTESALTIGIICGVISGIVAFLISGQIDKQVGAYSGIGFIAGAIVGSMIVSIYDLQPQTLSTNKNSLEATASEKTQSTESK